MDINIILFDEFETLDVFGPVEIFGKLRDFYSMRFYSENGGIIESSQGVKVSTQNWDKLNKRGILFIPGGQGTRKLVTNNVFISKLREYGESAEYCLTVCTGSGLLAKTGLLSKKSATSNKRAFDWAVSMDINVNWIKKARWTVDGKFYTSSGVSAGMDMSLAFVADRHDTGVAEGIAASIEYIWNKDKDNDCFAL